MRINLGFASLRSKPLDEVGTTRTLLRVTRFRERKTAEVSSDFPDRSWGSPQGPRRPRFSFLLFTCQTAWAETRRPKSRRTEVHNEPKLETQGRSPQPKGSHPKATRQFSLRRPPVRRPRLCREQPEERQHRVSGAPRRWPLYRSPPPRLSTAFFRKMTGSSQGPGPRRARSYVLVRKGGLIHTPFRPGFLGRSIGFRAVPVEGVRWCRWLGHRGNRYPCRR